LPAGSLRCRPMASICGRPGKPTQRRPSFSCSEHSCSVSPLGNASARNPLSVSRSSGRHSLAIIMALAAPHRFPVSGQAVVSPIPASAAPAGAPGPFRPATATLPAARCARAQHRARQSMLPRGRASIAPTPSHGATDIGAVARISETAAHLPDWPSSRASLEKRESPPQSKPQPARRASVTFQGR
jgi:hypothetical protein